jgi:hypothetical protein
LTRLWLRGESRRLGCLFDRDSVPSFATSCRVCAFRADLLIPCRQTESRRYFACLSPRMVYGFLATRNSLPSTVEVLIVPKLAATLASLLLIASSIGVNIARYPQVGMAVDSGAAVQSAEVLNSASAAQQSSPAESSGPASSKPDAVGKDQAESPKPCAGAAEEILHKEPRTEPTASATAPSDPAISIVNLRPMVPVSSSRAGAADPPAIEDEVRRLPPVELSASSIASQAASDPGEGARYPATSTP